MGANILPKPFFIGMTLWLVILAACGTPTAAPTSQTVTAAPTAGIVQATQPPSNPTLVPSTVEGTVTIATTQPPNNQTTIPPTAANASTIPSGITAEGYYYLGSPDAKVTLIDYSDFL